MVDMYVRNSLLWILLCTYVITTYVKKATPRTARTVPRRLTKPLSEVTVMAGSQHTQTHPEFTWRFLSTSERNPTAKPLVIYVNASSEQEARDTMPGVTLIFAARLPFHAFQVMEVNHA
ncbi:host cell division inhibitor Icd-like protein [Klebsiella quasipneumoniae]|uniref:host cell division inhibitor Icd-like protein n=1 Tax=Klebsiella quasipneumoniae TaxID=1463165 RepID=UPI0029FEE160|nr:host cell division inhibitor Icd-like protein [Klebsiella quasipneumoniae]